MKQGAADDDDEEEAEGEAEEESKKVKQVRWTFEWTGGRGKTSLLRAIIWAGGGFPPKMEMLCTCCCQ